MAYYEYNRKGNTIRSRRSSQRAIPIVITEVLPDTELDKLEAALKTKLGNENYWQWYYKLPYNVQMVRRLFVGAMRTKLAELAEAQASE